MANVNEIRAGEWTPAVKSVVRWIEEMGVDKVVQQDGSTENHAIVRWYMPPKVAAIVFDYFGR